MVVFGQIINNLRCYYSVVCNYSNTFRFVFYMYLLYYFSSWWHGM